MQGSKSTMTYQNEYKRLRAKDWNAKDARRVALINAAFDKAEQGGLVRFRVLPDESIYDDSYIDTWTHETEEARKEAKKELWEKIEREGVWGILAEIHVKCSHCGADRWDASDSVLAFVGEDWKDSGYDTDVKGSALQAVGILVSFKKRAKHSADAKASSSHPATPPAEDGPRRAKK
jgi:hypothetical protein